LLCSLSFQLDLEVWLLFYCINISRCYLTLIFSFSPLPPAAASLAAASFFMTTHCGLPACLSAFLPAFLPDFCLPACLLTFLAPSLSLYQPGQVCAIRQIVLFISVLLVPFSYRDAKAGSYK
jgi:hypothetical protein